MYIRIVTNVLFYMHVPGTDTCTVVNLCAAAHGPRSQRLANRIYFIKRT